MPDLRCLVETPKGSRNRYAYDAELGAIAFDRFLFASVAHPADCGLVPDTLGDGGRPLAALVCVSAPTFPGCVIPARAVGVLRGAGVGERLVCVPLDDPAWSHVEDVGDLPAGLRDEIETFFAVAARLGGEPPGEAAWEGREAAARVVEAGRRRYAERRD